MTEGPGAKTLHTRSLTRSTLEAKTCLVWGSRNVRQFKQVLDAYEAALRDTARGGSDQVSGG